METIFEHNITKDELLNVTGSSRWTREKILELSDSQIDHYTMIYRLYRYRGDYAKAKEYADKIPDTVHKLFETCNHDFAK
ncbi:MAG: hypothetical protein IKR25_10790 [Muribaculaceae bacterium]|nr:hypothetical protein [Muribaculaceae bacterium]